MTVLGASSAWGEMHYAVVINAAESCVEEAKAVGANELAPYEYDHAKERYSDAAHRAPEAEPYANTGIELALMVRSANP